MQNSGFHGNETKKKFKILLLQNWLADFQIILLKCSLDDPTLYTIPSNQVDWSKNMAARGGAILPYMAIVKI